MSNPIIQRELVGTVRMGRAFMLEFMLVVVLTALILLKWPGDALVDLSGAQAQQVLRVFLYGLMATVMLLAPAFPATSIVREKAQGTMTLLLNTPMTRWSILSGKMVGILGFILLLLVLSLPAAAACYAMGGVDLKRQLLMPYLLLLLMALQYSSMGLWVSSWAATADAALRITYGLVLVFAVLSLGPHYFAKDSPFAELRMVCDWIQCASPIPAMMEAMDQSGIGAGGMIMTVDVTTRFIGISLAFAIVFLLLTARRLDMRMFDKARPAGKVTDDRSTGVKAYRRVMFLFDPKRRSGLIGPLANAVLVKEFRTRRFGRAHWMMRLFGICLILSLGLVWVASIGTQERGVSVLGAILVVLQMTLLILMTPSLASGLISAERETGGWLLLQNTPLSARSIVFGKLVSVSWTLLLLLLATLPGYAVLIFIDTSEWVRITQVLITMVITAIFALLLSASVSSFFKRTAPATTTAYAVLVGIVAGTMLFHMGRGAPFSTDLVERVLAFNPLAAALQQIRAPQFEQYQLVPLNWWYMAGACLICLLVLLLRTWRLTKPS
ncbi:MAG: ABC transporter [Phycisphaeraceae bacterium]|nr:ABC transporter [Phycisphaeraceae bacterium]